MFRIRGSGFPAAEVLGTSIARFPRKCQVVAVMRLPARDKHAPVSVLLLTSEAVSARVLILLAKTGPAPAALGWLHP